MRCCCVFVAFFLLFGHVEGAEEAFAWKVLGCLGDKQPMLCYKTLFFEEFLPKNKYLRNFSKDFFGKNVLSIDIGDGFRLKATSANSTAYLKILRDNTTTGLEETRGMKKRMMNFLPFLLAPALMLAGVMPWVIPPLKMAVMFATMINNMALSSAAFLLIRNHVFNIPKDEHVVYINHGYKKVKSPPKATLDAKRRVDTRIVQLT